MIKEKRWAKPSPKALGTILAEKKAGGTPPAFFYISRL
jgi:hypothetical protein